MGAQYGGRDAAEEFRAMGRSDLAREYEIHRKVERDPRITRLGQFFCVIRHLMNCHNFSMSGRATLAWLVRAQFCHKK